jgi:hypothetical protein
MPYRAASRVLAYLLPDGFVLQDDSADELGHARAKKHFTVSTPGERIEPARQGGNGLIGCENSLPVGNQPQCNALEIIDHQKISFRTATASW